jgi:hypothetical protein
MAEQSSPPPAETDRTMPSRSGVFLSNYSVLIAAMAFLLSLVTTMISIWTGHVKDVHDQQAHLVVLTQDLLNLDLKVPEIRRQYEISPDLHSILTSIAQQERSIHGDAVALALGLGTNAPAGELITLAKVSAVARVCRRRSNC